MKILNSISCFPHRKKDQEYVDRYKQSILADGSTVIAERVNFAPQPQSSMSVIDQHTGYVKAICRRAR